MSDLLSPLTAERLEELAKRQDGVIGFLAAHGYNDEYLMNFVNAAAVLRALAGAERAILVSGGILSVEAEPTGGFAATMEGATGAGFTSDNKPTLIAALASAAKQEET